MELPNIDKGDYAGSWTNIGNLNKKSPGLGFALAVFTFIPRVAVALSTLGLSEIYLFTRANKASKTQEKVSQIAGKEGLLTGSTGSLPTTSSVSSQSSLSITSKYSDDDRASRTIQTALKEPKSTETSRELTKVIGDNPEGFIKACQDGKGVKINGVVYTTEYTAFLDEQKLSESPEGTKPFDFESVIVSEGKEFRPHLDFRYHSPIYFDVAFKHDGQVHLFRLREDRSEKKVTDAVRDFKEDVRIASDFYLRDRDSFEYLQTYEQRLAIAEKRLADVQQQQASLTDLSERTKTE